MQRLKHADVLETEGAPSREQQSGAAKSDACLVDEG